MFCFCFFGALQLVSFPAKAKNVLFKYEQTSERLKTCHEITGLQQMGLKEKNAKIPVD